MRRITSLLAAAGAAALVAVALAGCASPASSAPTPTVDTSVPPASVDITAAWLDGGRSIGLVTLGSSTCLPIADPGVLEGDVLVVTLTDADDATGCTDDLVPRATVIAVPEGVDPAQDLSVKITGAGYEGETTLAGAQGLAGPGGETDYLPSAGWTGNPGEFVLLSWGSSTCVPVVADAAPTAAAEVTVTFQAPPADQVCTMDMAPRGTVVQVEGLATPDGAEAVLGGSPEFDGVRIPIVGAN
jgi:hypothetical protein